MLDKFLVKMQRFMAGSASSYPEEEFAGIAKTANWNFHVLQLANWNSECSRVHHREGQGPATSQPCTSMRGEH